MGRLIFDHAAGLSAILLGLIVLTLLLARRWRERWRESDGALHHLARAARLGRRERSLIRRLAEAARITQPAALLISPACFDAGLSEWSARGGDARLALQLRDKLFPPTRV